MTLAINIPSQDDLMIKIWCLVITLRMLKVSKGYHYLALVGIESFQRKKTGSKVDLLFKNEINEMGTTEASKTTDMDSTKVTVEYGIKTPKVLNEMFYDMMTINNTSCLHTIQVFGYIVPGLQILPTVTDCRSGVVSRINRSTQ
ncbi:hypothetical protein BDA99DRAFT_555786 [Phascolomyces articulosus]|uniref:Uncharacterized protein n=1 Tax=Phascolomyces articulosus TaxID=60185 RepID=A0AAD5PHU2_9FUNG|nr:hypothetical protein BDA99DRAFT_555786 [Phascolomyces articulosus]